MTPDLLRQGMVAAMLIGFFTAWMFYIRRPDWPAKLAENQRPLYNFLLNKWYFDEIYDWAFVRPAKWLGRFLWTRGDGATIDGAINGVAMGIVPFFTRLAMRGQSGYLFHYAFAMVIGIAVLNSVYKDSAEGLSILGISFPMSTDYIAIPAVIVSVTTMVVSIDPSLDWNREKPRKRRAPMSRKWTVGSVRNLLVMQMMII